MVLSLALMPKKKTELNIKVTHKNHYNLLVSQYVAN